MKAITFLISVSCFAACGKSSSGADSGPGPKPAPADFSFSYWTIDNIPAQTIYYDVKRQPVIRFKLPARLDRSTVNASVALKEKQGNAVTAQLSYELDDSMLVIRAAEPLKFFTRYTIDVAGTLKTGDGGKLKSPVQLQLVTSLDSSDKFPRISDDDLLTRVQQQTFRYFWDFAHPVSGMARDRNTSGDIVTTGGTGFGIMAIIVGTHRKFITREAALARVAKITGFLQNAQRIKGAFSHWINGATGAIVPFSAKDNGADVVETAFLMQGLLTARQYFNGADAVETALRANINQLWQDVQWDWFTRNNENVLYWHYSNEFNWDMNLRVRGWNECLITYVLAAASPAHSIPKEVYTQGWADNGNICNNASYYDLLLPLGPAMGGPLFFSHYSFLGLNPNGLSDAWGNYQQQVTNHSLINYKHAVANPNKYFGYSAQCWGFTASDIPDGYAASSPTNDLGVIAPTAALSSFPYTPDESMAALKFFYYVLGDKLFKEYGFADAFSLNAGWFADSFIAIDQGPIIVMIENHRSKLIWDLFMSCPEVKAGLQKLGFHGPGI
ncbi:beta-glucosidase [Pseudoflavitalea sp. G-6-1-2]|uniref:glucoamylase family protein n=1 Tax=Pseudoflavitalea sp. G-6-1-2 TaxID=2728841 RepID=UPI00146B1320|nr:glucoamylase family protein [Pseudoflavitalea sp. G-6-1-2]NML20130.1 beta-glucosidase [Pseudoflavitalea sp. G-6-1-2]